MNKRLTLIIIMLYWFSHPVFPQLKELTLEDASAGGWYMPKTMKQLQWRNEMDVFTWVKNDQLIQGNLKDTLTRIILNLSELNQVLKENGIEELKSFPAISWNTDEIIRFRAKEYELSFNMLDKKIKKVLRYDEHGNNFTAGSKDVYAFTKDNNLYLSDSTGKITQVTNDPDTGIVNGQAVSRNEFGIAGGIFWSPDGNYLAFYHKDESRVSRYPLVDITKTVAGLKNIRYPMAGSESEYITLGVYDLKTRKTVFMETGLLSDQYLTCITWSPDEKFIFIALLNREQNYLKLNCYDAMTGKYINTLFEEKNDKYIEPQDPLYFFKTKPLQFIWFSRRDGFRHLYLYHITGKFIKQLTQGRWEVSDIIGFDKKEQNIFIRGNMESPVERNVYKLNLSSGKIKRINPTRGSNRALLNNSGKYLIGFCSNLKMPRNIDLFDSDGKLVRNLFQADNPFSEYKLGELSIFTIKAADGITDLYCKMIMPPDFNPEKKYPVILYVYGGPHSQLVTDTWLGGSGLFDYYLAQKGYIIFTVDNRGTSNRGLAFENVIHRNLGENEMADQVKGVEYLKTLGYIDINRIGVSGWSYGGFMTVSLMTHYPEIFKVGVAGGAVIDWKYYEVMYGERYMDTPQENPEGYKKTSTITSAENLKGKLLLVHGAMDNTVVWQNTLSFLLECVNKNIQVDYFVYPATEHGVGKDRLHLNTKILQYFDEYLR